MTDLDRSSTKPTSPVRVAAWSLLALCTAGNMVLSARGGALAVHLVLGVATLLCLAVLAATYLRRGR
jgi:hypothetical protein